VRSAGQIRDVGFHQWQPALAQIFPAPDKFLPALSATRPFGDFGLVPLETFNTFNHTQFTTDATNTSIGRAFGSSTFLEAKDAHDPRIMQFALKFIF
jgi:hypothetical protein